MNSTPEPIGQYAKLEPELLKLLPKLPVSIDMMNGIAQLEDEKVCRKLMLDVLQEIIRQLR